MPTKVTTLGASFEFGHTPTVTHMNVIKHGGGNGERGGRQAFLKAMYFKGKLYLSDATASAANSLNICHFFLVWDKRPGDTAPGFPTVFTQHNNEPATAMINIEFTDRFRLLKKWTFRLHGGSNYVSKVDNQLVNRYFRLNKKVEYTASGETGALSEIVEGGMYLYCVNSQQNTVHLELQSRLYFN